MLDYYATRWVGSFAGLDCVLSHPLMSFASTRTPTMKLILIQHKRKAFTGTGASKLLSPVLCERLLKVGLGWCWLEQLGSLLHGVLFPSRLSRTGSPSRWTKEREWRGNPKKESGEGRETVTQNLLSPRLWLRITSLLPQSKPKVREKGVWDLQKGTWLRGGQ